MSEWIFDTAEVENFLANLTSTTIATGLKLQTSYDYFLGVQKLSDEDREYCHFRGKVYSPGYIEDDNGVVFCNGYERLLNEVGACKDGNTHYFQARKQSQIDIVHEQYMLAWISVANYTEGTLNGKEFPHE